VIAKCAISPLRQTRRIRDESWDGAGRAIENLTEETA